MQIAVVTYLFHNTTEMEVIEKTNLFVVYQRITGEDGIKNEQIYLSTPELDEKLSKFYAEKEMEMPKN